MEWVRQHSNGSRVRCYRVIGRERSFRYVFVSFRIISTKFTHTHTHKQSDPHDAKTLIRTKIKFSLPPSSLNSRKLLAVSPKDAEVDLNGRGDSLYLGKYRKIKIPFEITDAKFNWKTRRIDFILQNDGLNNTGRVRSVLERRARDFLIVSHFQLPLKNITRISSLIPQEYHSHRPAHTPKNITGEKENERSNTNSIVTKT